MAWYWVLLIVYAVYGVLNSLILLVFAGNGNILSEGCSAMFPAAVKRRMETNWFCAILLSFCWFIWAPLAYIICLIAYIFGGGKKDE